MRIKDKRVQALLALIIALAIALVGTFAWNSFNQSRINVFTELMQPDVNLHDDFEGGPNKDVYVENSGQSDIFVRIKLTEFLETLNRGSMVAGHELQNTVNDEGNSEFDQSALENARNWAAHNGLDNSNDTADQIAANVDRILDTIGDEWETTANFHEYYTWLMGADASGNSWLYYKPATEDQKGVYDEAGNNTKLAEVVADPLTGTSPLGDAHLEYKAQVEAEMANNGGDEAAALETLGLKKTLAVAGVMTMDAWKTAGSPTQNGSGQGYWVVDKDGWCYWTLPLGAGEATGPLLDKVTRTEKDFDSNAEYAINVWLQAVDEGELGLLSGNGGITGDAQRLLNMATGNLVLDGSDPQNSFRRNSDGTYTEADEFGNPKEDGKTFILLGDAPISTVEVDLEVNALAIGSRFNITELGWNTLDYDNFDGTAGDIGEAWTADGLYQNIAVVASGGDYEVIGTVKGRDGATYLKVSPVDSDAADLSQSFYLASTARTSAGGDGNDTPEYTYSNVTPGMGPFAFVYPAAGGNPGGSTDQRANPSVSANNQFFYHVGNGVYMEVAADGDTTAIAEPVKYYFAGKVLSKREINVADATLDGEDLIEALFPQSLTVGDHFNVTLTETASGSQIYTTGSAYTVDNDGVEDENGNMTELGEFLFDGLEMGDNGKWYIYLGSAEDGYFGIGVGAPSQFLGVQGSDGRVWAGPNGIGNAGDIVKMPPLLGSGTQADPFKVRSQKEMDYIAAQLAANNSFAGSYFEVISDFDLNNTYKPIGGRNKPFRGIFDGAGHTITSLTLNAGSAEVQGLFGWNEGTIKNISIGTVTITGTYKHYGGIAGVNYGTVENCHVLGGTIASGNTGDSGGIVGWNDGSGKVVDCTNAADLNATGPNVGGIVGNNRAATSIVENCTNTGDITVTGSGKYVGGIVGYSYGKVLNSTNEGTIDATAGGQYIGGIVGYSYGTGARVEGCVNNGTVNNTGNYTGGVAGYSYSGSTVRTSYNTGTVTGTGTCVGGVVGYNYNGSTLTASYNTGNVSGGGYYTGGVAGINEGTITYSYSTGNVNGAVYTGGITGYANGNMNNCYAWGNVSGGAQTGGVEGYHYNGTTQYCYFGKGTINGTNSTGGITGEFRTGNTSYCATMVTSITAGNVANRNYAIGYWTGGSTPLTNLLRPNTVGTFTTSGNGNPGTGVASFTQANFQTTLGFNFSTVWEWNATAGMPTLKGITK